MMRHQLDAVCLATALPFQASHRLAYVETGDGFDVTFSALDRVMIRDLRHEDEVMFFRADPLSVESLSNAVLDGLSIARSMRPAH